MPRGVVKKEAAPLPPKSLLKKSASESSGSTSTRGWRKRNVRDRESTDYSNEGYENEWHDFIKKKNWLAVHELLEQLKYGEGDKRKKHDKKRKSKTSKGKRPSISWLWKGSGSSHSRPEQILDEKSLLVTNAVGRTPLHLALNELDTPDIIVFELLRAQPKAVSVPDGKGRLPLHFAVVRQKTIELMAELVDIYPQALSHEDDRGKTPLSYAMEVAKRQTDLDEAPPTFWAYEQEEGSASSWQQEQTKLWEVSRWLLLASASHRETQLTMDDGQPLLIEALLHAAPPAVISLLIAASSILLKSGDRGTSYCCSAMYLVIFRQYPLFVLRRLGTFCPDDVRFVRDETGLGLVSAHYVTSCFQKSKLLEYVAAEDFMATLEQCIVEGDLASDNPLFLDWWTKLKYLIFFCADKGPDSTSEHYLLHAALVNTDTPPNVIRLLLALYPDSARQVDPNSAHPLHLYTMHREYIPRNYESPYMHGLNVMDMLLSLDETSVFQRFNGRLPIHHAIASGRQWATLHPLISNYRSSLRVPDPITNVCPALLAAAFRESPGAEKLRLLQLTRNQYSSIVWRGLSEKQQQTAITRMGHMESLKRLDTIYELLRRYPQCVETAIEADGEEEIYAHLKELGGSAIASHYLSWCYKKVEGRWEVCQERMEVLKTNIRIANERGVLSNKWKAFSNWLRMLKLHIWRSTEIPTIPRDDNFLLHAAVSGHDTPPDVVQLLLGLYPGSAFLALPDSHTLPLHLACQAQIYRPRHFEVLGGHSVIDLLVRASPETVFMRSEDGRLPLHVAATTKKTFEELQPLVKQGPATVAVVDPITKLYPFQMVAVSYESTDEDSLNFENIAKANHGKSWNHYSYEKRAEEIDRVQIEYQLASLSTSFEFLRLNVSVLEKLTTGNVFRVEPNEIVLESPVCLDNRSTSYHDRPKVSGPKKKQSQLRRLLSGLSGDSPAEGMRSDASAFSSVDMVSTISNVSSHLSFRARKRVAGVKSDHKASGSLLEQNADEESESEESDIYSEEMSFGGDDEISESVANNQGKCQYGEDVDWSKGFVNVSQQPQKDPTTTKPKKGDAPFSYTAETPPNKVDSEKHEVPREILDVSLMHDANQKPTFREKHIGECACALDNKSDLEEEEEEDGTAFEKDIPEDANLIEAKSIKEETQVQEGIPKEDVFIVDADSQFELGNDEAADSPTISSPESLEELQIVPDHLTSLDLMPHDLDSQAGGSPKVPDLCEDAKLESEETNAMADDESIQDEIVHENESSQAAKEEEEEGVVFFRLRRSACRNPGGMKLRRKKRSGVIHNDSSIEMDFLSILNASLPEGGMDYLSTLEASSGSLPTGYDGLAFSTSRIDRMQQIKEFPSESEHGGNIAINQQGETSPAQLMFHKELHDSHEISFSEDGAIVAKRDQPLSSTEERASSSSGGGKIEHFQQRRSKYKGRKPMGAISETVIQWQRNRHAQRAPVESRPRSSNGSGASIIQWSRNNYENKGSRLGPSPRRSSRGGESVIQWRRNRQEPQGSLSRSPNDAVESNVIEWRRNKHDGRRLTPIFGGKGRKSSKASESVLSALEARRNSLEISARTSNYMSVTPQRLKLCLQCGLRERGVLMLPCTHLCLCRECSEDADGIKSCPICMGPVIDTMVVLG